MRYTPQVEYELLQQGESRQDSVGNKYGVTTAAEPQWHPVPVAETVNALPIDGAPGTKRACYAGLILSTLIGITALIVGIISKGSGKTWNMSPVTRELSILPVNVLLLFVTESLGYIHATSLRWALFHEGRLNFNANLRLLTFPSKSGPNSAFCTSIFLICIAVTYAAGNMLLVFNTSEYYKTGNTEWASAKDLTSLTKSIPIYLGLAILVMCAISFWSIKRTQIPSWSSDPFTTVSVALKSSMVHHSGRAMMSVKERDLSSRPSKPNKTQPSVRSASKNAARLLFLNIAILVALVVWSAVITYVAYHGSGDLHNNGSSWGFFPTNTEDGNQGGFGVDDSNKFATLTVFLFFFASVGNGVVELIPEGRMITVLLFYLAIQSVITIGLHCAELQCQLARDEVVWRSIESRNGSQVASVYNSITQPFKSWQAACLLVFKVVLHWFFGTAIQVDYGQGILMRPPQIVYLTAAWFAFVMFLVAVTLSRPRGSLPASYGHLQTMANVVDVWSAKMYWGDKGLVQDQEGVRHAGTSQMPLTNVLSGESYS